MSEVTGLQLTTSLASKQRRFDSLLAGRDPDAPDLAAAVTDAQILGSLELAGVDATWDPEAGNLLVLASRRCCNGVNF